MAIGQDTNSSGSPAEKTFASTLQVVAGKKAEIENRIGKSDKLTISFDEIAGQTMLTLASKDSNSLQKTEGFLLNLGLAKRIEKNSNEITEKEATIFTTNELYLPVSHRFTKEKLALKIGGTEVPGMVRIFGPPKAVERAEQILEEYRLGAKPAPSETKVFPLKHADCSNLASTLANAFRATKIGADPKANSITVEGDPKDITAIEALLSNLDVKSENKEPNPSQSLSRIEIPTAHETDLKKLLSELGNSSLSVNKLDASWLTIDGPAEQIEPIWEAMKKRGVDGRKGVFSGRGPSPAASKDGADTKPDSQFKVFHLKYAIARDLAETIAKLGFKKVVAEPEVHSNSVAVSGSSKDLAAIETLVSNLDRLGGGLKWPGGYTRLNIPRKYEAEMRAALNDLGNPGVVVKSFPEDEPFAVDGPSARVEQLEQLLTKRGLLGLSSEQTDDAHGEQTSEMDGKDSVLGDGDVKIFKLKYVSCNDMVATLEKLKLDSVGITANGSSNAVVVTGNRKSIQLIEALLSEFDQASRVQPIDDRSQDNKSDSTSGDSENHVYRLMNIASSDAVNVVKQMQLKNVKITEDARTNSLLIQSPPKELKLILRIVSGIDMKEAKPDPKSDDPATGTLWSDFAKAEAKSIATAGEMRVAAAKFGNEHPTMLELRTRLETEVKIAFDLRHKLQQAEAAELRRQLTEIESRLTKREKNKPAIIKARIDSLLKMDDLGWEAMTKPKEPKLDNQSASQNPLTAKTELPAWALTGKNREHAEAWERVDRDEYISVKIPLNFGGMGMGGFGGMGGMGGGFPGGPATAVAPAPVVPQYQQGVLIGGNAMIRDSYGLVGDQVVWFGAKQLPCRLAAVAPFSIFCYRSARFPSQGVTDFTHKPNNDEQVWAFVPDQMNTLVKAKVFRKSGAEFAIDEKTSFGIEAEGKIETGYIVCNNQGDFLGIIAHNYGSLGACWSAPAIGDWLKRTNLEEPTPKNPLDGRVIIALPGSAYVKDPEALSQGIELQPDRAFYGSVTKGVIVTHPEVSKSDLASTGKILYGGRTLTCEKVRLTENGRFTLIWCKELTPQSGFTSSHPAVLVKESVAPLGTRADGVNSFSGKSKTTYVLHPANDDLQDFEAARSRRSIVSKADKTNFEIQWLGIYNSIGLPVVTTGGHFLGIIDDDKPLSITTSEELRAVSEHHTVHVISAEEIFQFVDEETRKSTSSAEVTRSPGTASPSDSKPKIEPEVARREAAEAFQKRIKEPEAAIVVSVDHHEPGDAKSPPKRLRGSIVGGCIFVPELIQDDEYIQVDSKSLPQRLAGITPGGIHVYHRERLPTGFTKFGKAPKEGDRVWTVAPLGNGPNAMGAQVIAQNETTKEMGGHDKFTFAVESDFRASPGTVVLNDDGELVGIVAKSRGSLAVCEHATSIIEFLKRITIEAPRPADASNSLVWMLRKETQERWQGVIVQGVLVTAPDVADQDISTLKVQIGSRSNLTLTRKHGMKICNDRLALVWCNEIRPEDGIREFRTSIGVGDFAFSREYEPEGMHGIPIHLVNNGSLKQTFGFSNSRSYAARISEIRDVDFDLFWYREFGRVGDVLFDPGWHLLGIHVAKSAEERAKLGSPNATTVIKAAEIFRAIEEESKKLPPVATPEINTEKPAEKAPETPKTETTPEPPK